MSRRISGASRQRISPYFLHTWTLATRTTAEGEVHSTSSFPRAICSCALMSFVDT